MGSTPTSGTTADDAERWDLGELFLDEASFEAARGELREASFAEIDRFRGRVLDSAATLAAALDAASSAEQSLRRIQAFAFLRADLDTRRAAHQAARQQVRLLATELRERLSFLRPEIVAAENEVIEAFIRHEPRLLPHAHFLRDLMRRKRHVLSPAEERIVAESGLLQGEPAALYHTLVDADLPRREVCLADGTRVRLSPAEFQKHRTTAVRADRLALFPAYFAPYADFSRTLGQNLYAAVKAHRFRARVRGYSSSLEAALDPDHVPEAVYRNLIGQVRERLPSLHRYFELRRRALGLERLTYADLSCPLAEPPAARPDPAEARRRVVAGMQPLGADYAEVLSAAFDSRWIDWHPAPGKRSGAYSNGWDYAGHPYVLLNYNRDLEGVMTLAHEMGHALHSQFSNRAQPFASASYSIFVAEVASTFNETLVRQRMLDAAGSLEERRFLRAGELDGLRGTLFRQTMFAEFELEIHERGERGEALTGEKLSEIYLDLLRQYHGHDRGVVEIADDYAVEWAVIPHMYYDFYVYQYATGIVAATALARDVLGRRDGARARYLGFLAAGGSDYPLQLLRDAGVDLEGGEPFRTTFDAFDAALADLEREID